MSPLASVTASGTHGFDPRCGPTWQLQFTCNLTSAKRLPLSAFSPSLPLPAKRESHPNLRGSDANRSRGGGDDSDRGERHELEGGYRSNRTSLFDGIEEGGIRATSYSSHEIDEQENDRALGGLEDRVSILKRLSGDIHEEVETHNRMLDRMGNDMDSSRGFLSGTVDKFKMVFETKSSRRMGTLIASFVALFLLVYYLTR
ncbi:hypothetical protein ACP70R_028045 [Stipagrostis hirtigluma subsp. patula]